MKSLKHGSRLKDGSVHFEEYFVKRASKDEVLGVEFVGAAECEACARRY